MLLEFFYTLKTCTYPPQSTATPHGSLNNHTNLNKHYLDKLRQTASTRYSQPQSNTARLTTTPISISIVSTNRDELQDTMPNLLDLPAELIEQIFDKCEEAAYEEWCAENDEEDYRAPAYHPFAPLAATSSAPPAATLLRSTLATGTVRLQRRTQTSRSSAHRLK